MSLASKLQIKPGQTIAIVGQPSNMDLDLPGDCPTVADPASADAVIVFCAGRGELDGRRRPLIAAAKRDALAWLAYPKAGKLGTDLNRDSLRELLLAHEVQPVRQVAVDDVWSALRLRPA